MDSSLAPSQCVPIGDCILACLLIQNEGWYPWSHESNFWTLFHGSPILCKYRIKSFTQCLTKIASSIIPTRVFRVFSTFEIFQPLCVIVRESYATCLLLVPEVESSSSWRTHYFRLFPFPPADRGRSSHCSVVACNLGRWTMDDVQIFTHNYKRILSSKSSKDECCRLYNTDGSWILRTRKLVEMIINKGKPKSSEDNPSECSWGAGAQTATAWNKKLTRLGLSILTFYIRVHHAGPWDQIKFIIL